eukprot:9073752-Alexandrium_andersonii.AAC.1
MTPIADKYIQHTRWQPLGAFAACGACRRRKDHAKSCALRPTVWCTRLRSPCTGCWTEQYCPLHGGQHSAS